MCQFFSLISDGQGNIRYFDHQQRLAKVKMPDGGDIESYDSHTSIATFYGQTGAKEDAWNKWEYNPFTDTLILDHQNTADDRDGVMKSLMDVDWNALCGDVEAIRGLIAQVSIIPWFKNGGVVPEGVKLFETRGAARDAAWDAAWDAARGAAWDAAWDAARDAAWGAARGAAWDAARGAARDAARDAAWDAVWGAAWDAACLAGLLVCDGLELNPKHIEHMRKRWAVWEAGYGVLCDVDGVIYAYKQP